VDDGRVRVPLGLDKMILLGKCAYHDAPFAILQLFCCPHLREVDERHGPEV